jgi:hypothetical protein
MYAKVFSTLWHGSLVGQTDAQLVFCYLLAHARSDGYVEGHPTEVGALTGMGDERASAALTILESPDPLSRSPELEGRRLERIGSGWAWNIVNYGKYRSIRNEEDRKTQNREAKRRQRMSAKVSQGQPPSSQGEVEGEAEAKIQKTRRSAPDTDPEGFSEGYRSYPKKVGRRAASQAFIKALGRHPLISSADLAWAMGEYSAKTEKDGTEEKFIPHPSTWLNQDRFLEFFEEGENEAKTD